MLRILDIKGNEFDSIVANDLILSKSINELDTISFSLSSLDENSLKIKSEFLVETKTDIFKIKAIDRQKRDTRYEAIQNVDELKNKALIKGLKIETLNVFNVTEKLLEGTVWTVRDMGCSPKKRSAELSHEHSIWTAFLKVVENWKHEFRVDTKNKIIFLKEKFGEDKGVYFSDELNMHSFNLKVDTSGLYTRLYPYGLEGMNIASVNGGKEYIEDFTYTSEVIERVWKDERYTVKENLFEAAKERLLEASFPWISYSIDANDLASINKKDYGFLSYKLGDTITVVDSSSKLKDKQRVVQLTIDLNNPKQNTVQLSTKVKRFGDLLADIEMELFDEKNKMEIHIDKKVGNLEISINDKTEKIENNLKETTEKIVKIEADVSGIGLSVENVTNKVNNMEIGGYNYLLGSDISYTFDLDEPKSFKGVEFFKELRGKCITLSVDIEGDAAFERAGFEPKIIYEDGSIDWLGCWIESEYTGKERISRNFEVKDKPIKKIEQFGLYIQGMKRGWFKVSRPQLEVGNIATDWKPNPNDLGEVVTETVKRVGALEITDTAIKSSVSELEEKTTRIDGEVKSQDTRLKEAEQKIEADAIINTVKSTITAAKNEAIDSANSATDEKLKEYSTLEEFSEFKQTAKDFQFKVEKTTPYNLIQNSRPRKNLGNWTYATTGAGILENYGGSENINGVLFNSGLWYTANYSDGYSILFNTSLEDVSFDTNKQYTLNFPIYFDVECTYQVLIADKNSENIVYDSGNRYASGSMYAEFNTTFKPRTKGNKPVFIIAIKSTGYQIQLFLPWVNLYEGILPIEGHLESTRGVYTALTTIDNDGLRTNFDDGTFVSMGRDGFKYKHASWEHPYQYYTKIIKVSKKRNGYWETINLGKEFIGKQLDRDFKINHHIGAVDCNAYVEDGEYGGALRQSFTEIQNWNPIDATLQVRCCIQKITLRTEVMFGWDEATTDTDRGGIIGESAGDIVVIAQM